MEKEVDDRNYLQFFCRKDEEHIGKMLYNRDNFGAKSLPTCASFALQQYAKCFTDNNREYREASGVVLCSFYMNDLLALVNTDAEAKILSTKMPKILMKRFSNLINWASNDLNVLKIESHVEKTHSTQAELASSD